MHPAPNPSTHARLRGRESVPADADASQPGTGPAEPPFSTAAVGLIRARALAPLQSLRWLGAGLALLFLVATLPPAVAADQPVDPGLAEKAREVERLQAELEKARRELEALQRAKAASPAQPAGPKPTQAEQRHTGTVAPASGTEAPAAPAPASSLEGLPPLRAEEIIPAAVLLRHFRDDPEAASARYGDQTLHVEGEVDRFVIPLLQQVYEVQLAAPDRLLDLGCRFSYMHRYRAVYTGDRGRTLMGRIDDRSVQPLLRAGDRVVVRGQCVGLKDRQVLLRGCTLVSREPVAPR